MSEEYIPSYTPRKAEKPLSVVFVRHGQQDESVHDPEILGPPLTTLGKRQIDRVAKRLAGEKFNHVYASDLERALATAKAIMVYHEGTEFTVTHDLREVGSHHFLGMYTKDKPDNKTHLYAEKDALTRFVNKIRHAHNSNDKILVVCHGNLIRTLMPMLGGRNPSETILIDISHTAVSILELWHSGEAILKLANCTRHLLPSQVT